MGRSPEKLKNSIRKYSPYVPIVAEISLYKVNAQIIIQNSCFPELVPHITGIRSKKNVHS
jgi:hypothetical protein